MGAKIEILNKDLISNEEIADVRIKYSPDLKGIKIGGEIIPRLIDEIPIIALLATQAEGKTVISGAADLKIKNQIEFFVLQRNWLNLAQRLNPQMTGL